MGVPEMYDLHVGFGMFGSVWTEHKYRTILGRPKIFHPDPDPTPAPTPEDDYYS